MGSFVSQWVNVNDDASLTHPLQVRWLLNMNVSRRPPRIGKGRGYDTFLDTVLSTVTVFTELVNIVLYKGLYK